MFISIQKPAVSRLMRSKSDRGFSLIELMVTIAILGILASVAIPAYQRQVQSTRRNDVIDALVIAQLELQRCKDTQQSRTYDNCLTMDGTNVVTSADYYNVTIKLVPDDGASATYYELTAVPIAGTSQANDKNCTKFTLDSLDVRVAIDSNDKPNPKCWVD